MAYDQITFHNLSLHHYWPGYQCHIYIQDSVYKKPAREKIHQVYVQEHHVTSDTTCMGICFWCQLILIYLITLVTFTHENCALSANLRLKPLPEADMYTGLDLSTVFCPPPTSFVFLNIFF